MAATHLASGGTAAFSLPTGDWTAYAWVYVGASATGALGPTDDPNTLYVESDGSTYQLWHEWGPFGTLWGNEAGWIFVAFIRTNTQVTVYWRREGAWDMAVFTDAWTQGNIASGLWGGGLVLDIQYAGVYAGVLTEAQLLAQSTSTTQLVAGRSFWPLNDNSGAPTVGSYTMTLSGSSVASRTAPAIALGTPDPDVSTEFIRRDRDYAVYAGSPFATSYTVTVSAWVRLGTTDKNSYVFALTDGAEAVIFVCQHEASIPTRYSTNMMSVEAGDWGTCYTTFASTAECQEWVFVAFTITSSGTSRTCTMHLAPEGATLVARTVNLPTVTETGWHAAMNVRVGVSDAANGFEITHLRVHTSALTLAALTDLMASSSPDTTAWAHWPLTDGGYNQDVSGNGRHLDAVGELWPGTAGPTLTAGVDPLTVAVSASFAQLSGNATLEVGQPLSLVVPSATFAELTAAASLEVGQPLSLAVVGASFAELTADVSIVVGQPLTLDVVDASFAELVSSATILVGQPLTLVVAGASFAELTASATLATGGSLSLAVVDASFAELTADVSIVVGQPLTLEVVDASFAELTADVSIVVGASTTFAVSSASFAELTADVSILVGQPLTIDVVDAGFAELTAASSFEVGAPLEFGSASAFSPLTVASAWTAGAITSFSAAAGFAELNAAATLELGEPLEFSVTAAGFAELTAASSFEVGEPLEFGSVSAFAPMAAFATMRTGASTHFDASASFNSLGASAFFTSDARNVATVAASFAELSAAFVGVSGGPLEFSAFAAFASMTASVYAAVGVPFVPTDRQFRVRAYSRTWIVKDHQ